MKNLSIILFGLVVLLSACENDEKEANEISAQAIEDNAEFENSFTGIENVTSDASLREKDDGTYDFGNCANVSINPTWSSNIFPKTITIDFGDSNCLGRDGNYRRGKLIIDLSGRFVDSGTVITSRLDNYFQNDNKVEGTRTKENLGRNIDGNITYEVKVENGRIDHVNGYEINWNSERTTEWVSGDDTPINIFDDVYSIRGSATGFTRDGRSYSMNTTKDLKVALNCRWIKSGTITIKPEDFSERTVDYGDGACDRIATYMVNGRDFQFVMR